MPLGRALSPIGDRGGATALGFATVGKLTLAVLLIGSGLSLAPVSQAEPCDPNYSGACVPIASDVDCAGGSGNGPAYVDGPVNVIGKDIYKLDSNGDGVGCES